ncbi:MAG: hypothetical protein OEQ53_15090 [Saprospiraceae bacterium]|nr:hypothetical protein [Saprospiraceae bacterium]
MKKSLNPWILTLALILIAAGSRFIPHWHNFTAMGAAGLFGAAYLSRRTIAIMIPLVALFFSDLILNNLLYAHYFDHFVWFGQGVLWSYLGFAGLVAGGSLLLKKVRITNLVGAALLGSLVFFFLSNFGSFLSNPIYPKNLVGLVEAYIAGIPFFWNTVLANVILTLLMVGVFEWVSLKSLRTVLR